MNPSIILRLSINLINMHHTVQSWWLWDDGVTHRASNLFKVDLHIIVDDTIDMGYVQPTGGNIGTHQYTTWFRLEPSKRAQSLLLAHLTVPIIEYVKRP